MGGESDYDSGDDSGSDSGDPQVDKWSPHHLTDGNGNFILNNDNMKALLRYVWTGCLLATTRTDFTTKLGIDMGDITPAVWPDIDALLQQYKLMKDHTTQFRTVTYNNMVDVATQVQNYAETAGGESDDSYYGNMLKYARELKRALNDLKHGKGNQDAIDELRDDVQQFVSDLVTSIDSLTDKCGEVRTQLQAFEAECRNDQSALGGIRTKIDNLLKGDKGRIGQLREEIARKKTELDNDVKALAKERAARDRVYSYIWVWPIGTIVGAAELAKDNKIINHIKAAIVDVKDLLERDGKELIADTHLAADLGAIDTDVGTIIDMITPAIQTLTILETCFADFKGDLTNLSQETKQNDGDHLGTDAIEKVKVKKIIKHWNYLASEVKTFINIAYISQPEVKDLSQALKDYS